MSITEMGPLCQDGFEFWQNLLVSLNGKKHPLTLLQGFTPVDYLRI
jgi:hypothetical protein